MHTHALVDVTRHREINEGKLSLYNKRMKKRTREKERLAIFVCYTDKNALVVICVFNTRQVRVGF
jgi:hypothetical protein